MNTTEFSGLYIADTGNDCIRFAHPDGRVQTLELIGVPDVRETKMETGKTFCTLTSCKPTVAEEEKKEGE